MPDEIPQPSPPKRETASETPRTNEVLRIADNWGAIRNAAGDVEDGVTPEEAHGDMVRALAMLARTLERSVRNHAETLRGIASMDPTTEAERMRQWARDGLSGYAEPIESTLKTATDSLLAAEREREELRAALSSSLDKLMAEIREHNATSETLRRTEEMWADLRKSFLAAEVKIGTLMGEVSNRDRDWVLAMAEALGRDSGLSVPIIPEPAPFRELFARLRHPSAAGRDKP